MSTSLVTSIARSRHSAARLAATTATLALLIAGTAGCATEASASTQGAVSQHSAAGGKTLTFVATDIDGNSVTEDLGAKSGQGPDIGDLVAFTQRLTRDGAGAGRVHVSAIVVDHDHRLSEATGTLVIAGGNIQVAGLVAMGPQFTLSVTGGTGRYIGATGTMAFDATGDQQKLTVTLR